MKTKQSIARDTRLAIERQIASLSDSPAMKMFKAQLQYQIEALLAIEREVRQ